MTATPNVSVIIATYNRRALLARTLPTVLEQDFPSDEYEVVVVVDGSTDGTLEFLRSLKAPCALRILEQPNRGHAAAQNAAARAARGDLVIFVDDDIVCGPGLVRAHVAAHTNVDPRLVIGPIDQAPESLPTLAADLTKAYNDDYNERLARGTEPRWPACGSVDANTSLPRSMFFRCGAFDERLGSSRHTEELGVRLWKMGVGLKYAPKAVAHEIYVKSSRHLVEKDAWAWGRSEVFIYRKHPSIRPYSSLASLGRGSGAKRFAREVAGRLPISPEPILRLPCWVAERLRWIPWVRRAGIRLLRARQAVVGLRGAVHEAGSWEALRMEFGMRVPVLLYHHVGPPRAGTPPGLTVSPEQFERQVRWLSKRGYVGIRAADWVAWCREGKPLGPKPVLMTFDDAYADIADYALPVLKRHGFGAVVFVVTGQIGGENKWDQVSGSAPLPLMTAEQIRYWANQGIEFGAHSRTHPDLTQLTTDRLAEEVGGSGEDLARLLGRKVVSFAYPYGPYNEAACRSAQRAFDLAFTTDEGLNYLGTDLHRLRRTHILPNEALFEFACRARWGWNPIKRLRARLRLRSRAKALLRRLFGPRQAPTSPS